MISLWCRNDAQDGLMRSRMESRIELPKFETKANKQNVNKPKINSLRQLTQKVGRNYGTRYATVSTREKIPFAADRAESISRDVQSSLMPAVKRNLRVVSSLPIYASPKRVLNDRRPIASQKPICDRGKTSIGIVKPL
ncbi:hypothetical protein CEXT_696241 [Caerostris extrusa]|uniref:Uncharacterized protein n=1 Tax=Caerostris extrusa TaxID=172846 RepID=A0AAV4XIM5_CAEEX|nr:hypothetical protein CEXT_696241 [Caerostris extrusa]